MPKLVMQTASGRIRQVELPPEQSLIGRGSQSDIVIDSIQASRVHAVIDVEPAFVTIRDLGSRNGTFVNDVQVENQVLAEGDVIRLGSYEMRFVAGDQEFSQVEASQPPTVPGLLLDTDWDIAPTIADDPRTTRDRL